MVDLFQKVCIEIKTDFDTLYSEIKSTEHNKFYKIEALKDCKVNYSLLLNNKHDILLFLYLSLKT